MEAARNAARVRWLLARLSALLAILAPASALAADVPFATASSVASHDRIVPADIDGDGDLDYFLLEAGSGALSWRANDGSGGFGSDQSIMTGITTQSSRPSSSSSTTARERPSTTPRPATS